MLNCNHCLPEQLAHIVDVMNVVIQSKEEHFSNRQFAQDRMRQQTFVETFFIPCLQNVKQSFARFIPFAQNALNVMPKSQVPRHR